MLMCLGTVSYTHLDVYKRQIHILNAWPTINADNTSVAATYVTGVSKTTSVTLNTSGLSGGYYVLMGFSNNNSRSFTGYIYSLKCNF